MKYVGTVYKGNIYFQGVTSTCTLVLGERKRNGTKYLTCLTTKGTIEEWTFQTYPPEYYVEKGILSVVCRSAPRDECK